MHVSEYFPGMCVWKVSKGKVITKNRFFQVKKRWEVNSRSKSAKLRIFERV